MEKYSFLHDMLTCTDDELVDVVIMYLNWLGYNTAKKMDGGKILKEEDIQIDLGDGLLVIKDANNDKRGLLTTWELYQAYFWIDCGV